MSQQKNSESSGHGAHSRAAAANALFQVLEKGESLSTALPHATSKLSDADKRLASAISYGVLRVLPSLNRLVGAKLDKPLKGKLKVLHYLLLVGAYQLYCQRIKDHAAVSATVEAAQVLGKRNHKGLINGILRQLLREAPAADESQQRELPDDAMQNHPRWLFDSIKNDHPEHASDILTENNAHPPMWLRVNCRHSSRDEYLKQLQNSGIAAEPDNQAADAIRLQSPCPVEKLPGFADGHASVQDRSAQLAADYLNVNASHRVLDCCAAPGGKLLHLLERHSFELPVQAIDIDPKRLDRVDENLERAGLSAIIHCADVAATSDWWDGEPFDRILLDAPCSATGVIRRHPDIKWLRRADDINDLASLQSDILKSLWPLLKPGGELLYATCSILRQENQTQIESFLQQQSGASLIPIDADNEMLQLLPGDYNGDGFFYARLKKVE
ncbi:16S rRNA (cytosine(967)-C(5))-methyltransferase RsmB [Idiomarina sp. HP20-50]|uniref:16S rRNA (cytosine(967)-C(5))-methyltransferase RsmB n=1 Tax=Idiomarina sp. HP20-50 TaxID=3070813 RepID=UPI00294AC6D0|nr:16S rRNA (cytosine(967)-C(5))-methyltransferase RsmB [Idiomarina sp. HP20-50]MDV6316493.1 16S rRNA (cytosine(967)-C(5))-methyltransferase RsmB [Idiomarina sp. HP20-50]